MAGLVPAIGVLNALCDHTDRSPLQYAVDRNGSKKFRKDFLVKGLRPPKAALRALDKKILSNHTLAIAIDGFL